MLTKEAIDQAFAVHNGAMTDCESRRCYWALLHLVLAYPDICSGLQVPDPNSGIGVRYSDWCSRWVRNPRLTGPEWWGMRNKVMHQGSAVQASGGRYIRFSFSPPPARDHNTVSPPERLRLNVVNLANEMREAVEDWKTHLLSAPTSQEAVLVAQHLALVAVEYSDSPPVASPGGAVPDQIPTILKTH